jgi:hypothetical protein
VKIHSVGGVLENKTGVILGKSFVHILDHYIVLLDDPLPESLAICMTESCLMAE